jgi:hypothetical protein
MEHTDRLGAIALIGLIVYCNLLVVQLFSDSVT